MNIIRGISNSDADALLVKANNREYVSKGIQTKLDFHWNGEHVFHDLEIGLRYNYDEEDRFQWKDGYNMTSNGQMNLTTAAERGSDANRISSAKAFAGSILYKLKYKNLDDLRLEYDMKTFNSKEKTLEVMIQTELVQTFLQEKMT